MGEVFLACEAGGSPRACVVKKVLPNLVANRAFVGRFLDEAKVVVRLKHPNIAGVYAMGEVNGDYFLSMEYVQGKTVSRFTRRLKERKMEMPIGLVLLIGEHVCAGLQYAHDVNDEHGSPLHLVHRDLSPANVCISYGGAVKIIDFGAAQSTLKEEQTAPRVVIGNLTYMAPEQAKKQLIDGRADIYSCGVMLWELLSWHALPQKGDPLERWRKAANPSWDPPSLLRASVPQELDEVILKALRREPEHRWHTARELGNALRRIRESLAPDSSRAELGDLLAQVFQQEKVDEDAVLAEVSSGRSIRGDTFGRVNVVPPNALAFEHTAVIEPEALAAAMNEESEQNLEAQDHARGPLPKDLIATRPILASSIQGRRSTFGLTFADVVEQPIERSLIEEIEGFDGSDVDTLAVDEGLWLWIASAQRWKRAALFSALFAGAMGLGFLTVWMLMK
jgi:serine/threonine-protein kinase